MLTLEVAYHDTLAVGSDDAPLAASARHVIVEPSGDPLRPRAELAAGVRRVALAPPGPATWTAERVDAVLPGTTTAFALALEPEAEEPVTAPWERVELALALSDDENGAELAVAFEGWVVPRVEDEDEEGEPLAPPVELPPVHRREELVLDGAPSPGGPPLVLVLPAPKETAPAGGFVVTLALAPPPAGAEDELALEAALEGALPALATASERARAQAERVSESEGFRAESEGALRALADEGLGRSALLFLADGTGASLTAALALAADDGALDELVASLRAGLDERPPATDDPPALGWFLEGGAYRWLATRAAGDPADVDAEPLAPELHALLLRHTGELGRYPDLVAEAVAESGSTAALADRFVRENEIFLEDGHPAARARAFDWLDARGLAPADYDPLASRTERRAALAAAQREAEGAAEGAGE